MEGFADSIGGNVPLYGVVNRLLYGIGEGSTEPLKKCSNCAEGRAAPEGQHSGAVSRDRCYGGFA